MEVLLMMRQSISNESHISHVTKIGDAIDDNPSFVYGEKSEN